MLYYQTIDLTTLDLLKQLLQKEIFAGLRLVGGTALALQYGHRKSVDLDLFGSYAADEFSLAGELEMLGKITVLKRSPRINVYSIEGIKVDFVNYPYPWLENILDVDHLRLAHPKDIGAMKLAAITGRGTKKDFFDLYFLLDHFSLADLLVYYRQKFYDGSEFLVLKSLVYFEDAEYDEDPVMITPVSWQQVKEKVLQAHKAYMKTLR